MRNLPLIVLVLLLAACQTCPVVPPKVVHVTIEKIVPVPAELAAPCDAVAKRDNSMGEAVRLANARAAALEECSGRMDRIRNLAPAVQP
jgi:hypothetical protein